MQSYPVYKVDAFTSQLFGGNPAAVCPLETWLPEHTMQQLAAENNISETAFIVLENNRYYIRWFTPATEVKLCGHATLAASHIIFSELKHAESIIHFDCLSGPLTVTKTGDGKLTLDFPANPPQPVTADEIPEGLFEGLSIENGLVFNTSFDYMVVLPSQKIIEELNPDFKTLAKVKARGVIATAKGDVSDFVSRCFYPQSGIDEDPVTGSAHTIMVPFWANALNKNILSAIQISKRKGVLDCELKGDRVLMSGTAVTYLKGEYFM